MHLNIYALYFTAFPLTCGSLCTIMYSVHFITDRRFYASLEYMASRS